MRELGLWGRLQAMRWAWWLVAGVSGLSNLLMLTPTLYMLQVYDRVLVGRNDMTLLMVSVMALVLLTAMGFIDAWRSRLLVRLGVAMDRRLAPQVFRASLQRMGQAQTPLARKGLADLLELRQFLTGHGVMAFLDLPWAVVFVGVLFLLHVDLGGLALCFGAAQVALAWWGHGASQRRWAGAQREQASERELARTQLGASEAVHVMGMEPAMWRSWQQAHHAALQAQGSAQAQGAQLQAWSKWLRYSQQSLSLAAGAWLVIRGELSVGAMIAANVLMTRALSPVDQVVGLWRQWLSARAAAARLDDLLREPPEALPVTPVVHAEQVLRCRLLCAETPGGQPILRQVDLDLVPKALTVVVGPSGSGKSTLMRCLLGIWPWRTGELLLGDQAIAGLAPALGGQAVGYLPQAVELFAGSIAQNIARLQSVDSRAVIDAAQAAGLHDWVLRQPQGYDTPIGEAGQRLSGGQRQRLGLARALYGCPAWLLLDEPNAHLDDSGEQALHEALSQARAQGQGVVVVTHRPGILALADQVVVMNQGQVQWQGPAAQAPSLRQALSLGTGTSPA